MIPKASLFAALFAGSVATHALAQIAPDTPVEVTSDNLTVDQASGSAVFAGHVLVAQGPLKLSAGSLRVEYAAGSSGGRGRIARMEASGGVTLASATEAAEADTATYTVASGEIVMTGNVLLTQGATALTGDRVVVDARTGNARVEGRVRTVLAPAKP